MLEGQNGLNWRRWQRILQAAEDLGFQCVFRSDHFTNAVGPDYDSLELWVSLTYAASFTKRIEFGSLVCPVTFRHPAMTARMAAAVDDLSGGRLVLGLGAGWQAREHHHFGVPFYDVPTRHAMFEEALEMTSRLLESAEPVFYRGAHFSLDEAILLPRPERKIPILVGGNGLKRTLPLAAKYADEWNGVYLSPENYQARMTTLDSLLEAQGRKRSDVKRSLMSGTVLAAHQNELDSVLQKRGITFEEAKARGIIAGTPEMWVEQIGRFVEVGAARFMLQWLDLDDIAGLERIAKDVLPHFHN